MSKIIAGRFEQQTQVQQAVTALLDAGFHEDQISTFYVNPPGVHHTYTTNNSKTLTSTEEANPEMASGAMTGAAVGAAAGLVSAPLLEPVTAAVGALVGAHIGSFIGALSKVHDDGAEDAAGSSHMRKAGMMVAAAVTEPRKESLIFDVLQKQGATEIEAAQGTIVNGDWQDFDPSSPFVIAKH
jgi:hypothetical protein